MLFEHAYLALHPFNLYEDRSIDKATAKTILFVVININTHPKSKSFEFVLNFLSTYFVLVCVG